MLGNGLTILITHARSFSCATCLSAATNLLCLAAFNEILQASAVGTKSIMGQCSVQTDTALQTQRRYTSEAKLYKSSHDEQHCHEHQQALHSILLAAQALVSL